MIQHELVLRGGVALFVGLDIASFWDSAWVNFRDLPFSYGMLVIGLAITLIYFIAASLVFMRPLAYLVWIGSWATLWKVSNRLRAVAEHGGMVRSRDRRQTTHVIRQSLLARYWMVPYHTGWHLAHHVDMGVPWRNLPRLHAELVEAGWVTEGLEYPNYRALWRALRSRPEGATVAPAGTGA